VEARLGIEVLAREAEVVRDGRGRVDRRLAEGGVCGAPDDGALKVEAISKNDESTSQLPYSKNITYKFNFYHIELIPFTALNDEPCVPFLTIII